MVYLRLIIVFCKGLVRRLYWLYNIGKYFSQSSGEIHFPVEIEGKGQIRIDTNYRIAKWAVFGVNKGSAISIGKNFSLGSGSTCLIGPSTVATFRDSVKVLENSTLYIQGDWEIGSNSTIAQNCALFAREPGYSGILTLGNDCAIGDGTIIDICDDVCIGDDVALGPNCVLYTHDHLYDKPNTAAWKGGIITKPIKIGQGVWIGSNVTILPGVEIGDFSVLASGALVNRDVESFSVYGGVPAKKIKDISMKYVN